MDKEKLRIAENVLRQISIHEGNVPTPEEVIVLLADEIKKRYKQ